jgi:hypothetical protein
MNYFKILFVFLFKKLFCLINFFKDLNNGKMIYIFFKICISSLYLYLLLEANYFFIDNIKGINYINNHYFEFIRNINKNDLYYLLNKKEHKIEIIFLLINAIPFIREKIIIKNNKNKKIYLLMKDIFKNKIINNDYIFIDNNDYYYLTQKFDDIINYEWEFIPNKILIDNLRFIINNYYNEKCLRIFEKSLNYNFKIYIEKKKNFSFQEISYLMSKFLFIYFLNRKYWSL